jgi:hypothetical protein
MYLKNMILNISDKTFNFVEEIKMKQLKQIFPLVQWNLSDIDVLEKTAIVLTLDEDFQTKFDDLSWNESMEFIEKYGKYLADVMQSIQGKKK